MFGYLTPLKNVSLKKKKLLVCEVYFSVGQFDIVKNHGLKHLHVLSNTNLPILRKDENRKRRD